MLGWPEILLIFAVILLVFGPSKLPEMAKALGEAMREFRKATAGIEQEARIFENSLNLSFDQGQASQTVTPVAAPPDSGIVGTDIDVPTNLDPSEEEGELKLSKVAEILNISTTGKSDSQLRDEITEKIRATSVKEEEV